MTQTTTMIGYNANNILRIRESFLGSMVWLCCCPSVLCCISTAKIFFNLYTFVDLTSIVVVNKRYRTHFRSQSTTSFHCSEQHNRDSIVLMDFKYTKEHFVRHLFTFFGTLYTRFACFDLIVSSNQICTGLVVTIAFLFLSLSRNRNRQILQIGRQEKRWTQHNLTTHLFDASISISINRVYVTHPIVRPHAIRGKSCFYQMMVQVKSLLEEVAIALCIERGRKNIRKKRRTCTPKGRVYVYPRIPQQTRKHH